MTAAHQALVLDSQFAKSQSRADLWMKFTRAVATVKKRKTPVAAALLSGSFVSTKLDPSDVDAALIIDVSMANPVTIGVLSTLFDGFRTKLKLDLFMIPWFPDGSELGGSDDYPFERGRWDDFWQRNVPKSQRGKPVREHSMPVRGYLEVVIDGYR